MPDFLGYRAKIGIVAPSQARLWNLGIDPGSVCAESFHGSLWHTEDLRPAVCLHFGGNHRPLIESAVLSWESLLKIPRVVAVMIGIVLPLLAARAQAAELKVYAPPQ
jgi:hypothetical protein